MKLLLKMTLATAFLLGLLVFSPSAQAASSDQIFAACQGAGADSAICKDKNTQDNPIAGKKGIINTAANIIAVFSGIVAVIIIIISGLIYATAGGAAGGQRAGDSPTRAKTARSALIGAVIGLVIIALGWSIITFITDHLVNT